MKAPQFSPKTKIVATLGPASAEPGTLLSMMRAGMSVARVNLSHGTREEHARYVRLVRSVSASSGIPVGVLFDLRGLKMRVGTLAAGSRALSRDETVVLDPVGPGGSDGIPIRIAGLSGPLPADQRVLIDDGRMELRVTGSRGKSSLARVVREGTLKSNKGLNLPGFLPSGPWLSREDLLALHDASRLGVDFLALSFVRGPDDVLEVRRRVGRLGLSGVPVIAKIENLLAARQADEIASVSDGLMVARGDLGVEMPPEKVPPVQRGLIDVCNRLGKTVITATQMLESMIESETPTRAEVSDIAHAVFDGTDAVMLSGETAIGKHPVEAVSVMAAAAREAESSAYRKKIPYEIDPKDDTLPLAASRAACFAAEEARASAIVAFSATGRTARLLARQRANLPIVAFSPDEGAARRLLLSSGVFPFPLPEAKDLPSLLRSAEQALLARRILPRGAVVVFVAGTGLKAGGANLVRLHRLGEAL
ncbi:MAG: pyruvate kinase [Planctomycetota bacterium]